MSTNLNRIIKGAHPVGPLTGLPTGGCGKPGTATQPWECVPRESIPWKSKRNCPPLHGGGLPRLSRLGKVMSLHSRRREPLSHCMFTMDCRPTAPFSSSLGGWDAQPGGRPALTKNPTTPSQPEGPMPKEVGKRQRPNAHLVILPKTPQLLRSPLAHFREEMGRGRRHGSSRAC